jgi:3alpha(or 20beta)-hydroxysteroid dehydrogenase
MTNSNPIAAKDLKVVITGGARGIGGATAAELAALGSKVFITDVLAAEGNALATKLGANVTYADLDVTDPGAWQKVLAQADTAMGGINALFNNAGIVSWGNTTGTEPADFRKVIDVNL